MPVIYLVTAPNINTVKIGFWSGTENALWTRYKMYYGEDISVTIFNCADISDETKLHEEFAQHKVSGELFTKDHLDAYQERCEELFGEGIILSIDAIKEKAKDRRKAKREAKLNSQEIVPVDYSVIENLYCKLCEYSAKNQFFMDKHLETGKHQRMQYIANDVAKRYDSKIDQLERMLDQSIEKEEKMQETIDELKKTNGILEAKVELLQGLAEKAASRATTVNNIQKTKTNNILQLISSEPIDTKTFKTEIPKLVTVESILTNDKRFNSMIQTALLQDDKGQDKIVCTDMARKHFQYLDESTGKLISDPSLERLIDAMKKGVDYRKLSAELLEELNAIGGDPAENRLEAQRLMRRARFQTLPTHMAKKTYRACIKFDDTYCVTD